jgi:hypothetical protein
MCGFKECRKMDNMMNMTTMNIDTIPRDLIEVIWDHMSHGDRFILRSVNKAFSRDRMDGEEELRKSLRGCRPNRATSYY